MARYQQGFQGNRNVRAAGTPIQWDETSIAEFGKCAADPLYFITNYIKIKHVDHEQLIPFIPRKYQEEMLRKMLAERFVITKLPRQAGKTTIVAAVLLWHLIFNLNYSILIAANKGDKARDIVGMIKDMFESLPDFLQPGVKEYNKGTVIFESGSRVRASATSASAARGDTYNMIYIDEAAFLQKHIAKEFFESVIPTISSGQTTKVFITSTPKGLNHFYDMWMGAVEGDSGYAYVEIKWYDVPGRDEEFRKGIVAQYGQAYFDQEYAAEFLGSDRTLISGSKLVALKQRVKPPIEETRETRVYLRPEKGRRYAVIVDVSEGLGADYSVVLCVDCTAIPYKLAAIYRSNEIDPMALPGVIHEFATNYNDALVLVEANFGNQVGEILWSEFEYENLVWTSKGKSGPTAKQEKITAGFAGRSRVGLAQNQHSKRVGCSNLKTLVENDWLEIPDKLAVDELTKFVVVKKSYAAESGNDDVAMCLVMFAWLVDQGYIREETEEAARQRLRSNYEEIIESQTLPTGWSTRGDEDEIEAIDLAPLPPPAIDIPDPDQPDVRSPFEGLFDLAKSRGGMSESELHDKFLKDMFGWE